MQLMKLVESTINEKLVLKKYTPKNWLVVMSDAGDFKVRSAETFKAKNALKKVGFRWNTITDESGKQVSAWVIPDLQEKEAIQAIAKINKEEVSSDVPQEFEELVFDLSTISKKSGLDQKIIAFLDTLKKEVDTARASDDYQKYINFAKKFHNYSWTNKMLIWLQKPDATRVAGFRAWEALNRSVVKGAKGISIFVPMIYKRKRDKIEKGKSEPLGDDGLDKEVSTQRVTRFKVGYVFDISDTQQVAGKDDMTAGVPSWHADDNPNEIAEKVSVAVEDVLKTIGIKYTQDASRRGEQGYARGGEHINISSGVGGANKASALVHELAHTLLHFDDSIFSVEKRGAISKEVKEYQAEAVAAAVLDEYGLSYKHSANYIALWNEKLPEITMYTNMILQAAEYIINQIDQRAEK